MTQIRDTGDFLAINIHRLVVDARRRVRIAVSDPVRHGVVFVLLGRLFKRPPQFNGRAGLGGQGGASGGRDGGKGLAVSVFLGGDGTSEVGGVEVVWGEGLVGVWFGLIGVFGGPYCSD